jgi:peptide/nickel transport system substrate-binding protein
VREAHGGLALPATQLAPPGVFGYVLEMAGGAGPGPAAHRAVGHSAPVPLYFGSERNATVAAAVARDAARASITLQPRQLPPAELDALLEQGRAEAFLVQITFPHRDSSDFLSWAFHSPTADGRWGAGNFTRYSDPAADRLIEAAEREFNPHRRYALLRDAMRAAVSSHAWIPLSLPDSVHAIRRGLQWDRSATGRVRLEEITPAP